MQDVLREKLKELGFRVLIAADPVRAVHKVCERDHFACAVAVGCRRSSSELISCHRLSVTEDDGWVFCGPHVLPPLKAEHGRVFNEDSFTTFLNSPFFLMQDTRPLRFLQKDGFKFFCWSHTTVPGLQKNVHTESVLLPWSFPLTVSSENVLTWMWGKRVWIAVMIGSKIAKWE